ncbi:hypothetical protein RJ640_004623 [Escallonia rubra]|uniref:Late embryogenesis abundant protein LEA-2 subgroup domain-containing protein n=1 Tax=Escallonia rubra TaxID=112253 RepID=A0AA88R8Z3_9ASTE|nr:hypothetical protein RJ640_004623 [Escallonia rubra]
MSDHSGGGRGGCGRCCCSFILTSGLTALFMWLSLRTSPPVCSIQNFYVPALNKTANHTTNHTIYFDLKLDNENKDKGIYYDNITLTFNYLPNTTLQVANYTAPAFYQGHKKKTRRKALLEAVGVPWGAAVAAGFNGTFRVDLATKVRYKIVFWKTKRHKLEVGTTLVVNEAGKKVNKKGDRLKSGAPGLGFYGAPVALLVVVLSVMVWVFV